ncbi:hypothetical protein AB0C28_50525 [Nonomuraea sp. NPDC048892]|uniref:hypothetical protein n=1 Tax=Nonomuraea sp. NPDC048892 TaxID=3154624 RepID=UPI003407E8C9
MKSPTLHATARRAAAVIAPLLAAGTVSGAVAGTATVASASAPLSATASSDRSYGTAAVWVASNVQLVNRQTGKCLTIAGVGGQPF